MLNALLSKFNDVALLDTQIMWYFKHLSASLQFVGASMGTSNLKVPSESLTSLPSRACCVVVEYLPGTLKKFLYSNRKKKLALKIVIQLALDLSRG